MGDQELIKPSRDIPVNIEDEMRKSYLDYAMSVIIGRALPDVRDGLKPVHRRILYAMYKEGNTSDKRYIKCAGMVGEVIKKYHPHGDAAVYDTLVRMAQDFNMRYPLIDGQGNFGSVDGDPAAAYRYTECRLAKLAEEMLADIEKDTVDFIPNFDESTEEPTVLPTRVPGLLINGSDGIAVGMATKIPPHNLTEIIEATILLLNKPTASIDEMLALVPGPDFPTGAYIYGKSGIKDAYRTGRGQFTMRAKAAIERPAKEKVQIVITEIPFQVNKSRVIERIAELVQDKKIEGISDVRDESDRDGMRIVIELKRGEQPEVILNNLYKHTQLQETFGMIMLAIVHGQPRTLPLIDALQLFIDHRVNVVRRRTEYDLRKAQERAHILEGFLKALSQLDAIIKLIRASKTPAEARAGLMTRFEFTERQAQAILEMQLQRLTALERDKIQAGVRRAAEEDRRVPGNPGQRQGAEEGHRQRAEGNPERLRRRAAHGDHRAAGRDQAGGPDRRPGRGHHRLPFRLHQAHAAQHLSPAGARRQGPAGHEDARGGLRRKPLHRLHPQLHPGVYQHRKALLAEGV